MTIASEAVEWALRQVGKPYVFGAAGPQSFDCSGLVCAAYEHVGGPPLPHYSVALRQVAEHVGRAHQLQPGDLVFYYGTAAAGFADTDHVALFVDKHKLANGHTRFTIVQATDPAHGVETVRMRAYARPTSFGRITS